MTKYFEGEYTLYGNKKNHIGYRPMSLIIYLHLVTVNIAPI